MATKECRIAQSHEFSPIASTSTVTFAPPTRVSASPGAAFHEIDCHRGLGGKVYTGRLVAMATPLTFTVKETPFDAVHTAGCNVALTRSAPRGKGRE